MGGAGLMAKVDQPGAQRAIAARRVGLTHG